MPSSLKLGNNSKLDAPLKRVAISDPEILQKSYATTDPPSQVAKISTQDKPGTVKQQRPRDRTPTQTTTRSGRVVWKPAHFEP